MLPVETLPRNLLERLFDRDMHRDGWRVDIPVPANDDDPFLGFDPSFLLAGGRRRNR